MIDQSRINFFLRMNEKNERTKSYHHEGCRRCRCIPWESGQKTKKLGGKKPFTGKRRNQQFMSTVAGLPCTAIFPSETWGRCAIRLCDSAPVTRETLLPALESATPSDLYTGLSRTRLRPLFFYGAISAPYVCGGRPAPPRLTIEHTPGDGTFKRAQTSSSFSLFSRYPVLTQGDPDPGKGVLSFGKGSFESNRTSTD